MAKGIKYIYEITMWAVLYIFKIGEVLTVVKELHNRAKYKIIRIIKQSTTSLTLNVCVVEDADCMGKVGLFLVTEED